MIYLLITSPICEVGMNLTKIKNLLHHSDLINLAHHEKMDKKFLPWSITTLSIRKSQER